MKVRILKSVTIKEGVTAYAGDTVDVPKAQAEKYIEAGYAETVKASKVVALEEERDTDAL